MHFKRNISTSVTDLQLRNMSDTVKRLAIARNGHPVAAPSIQAPRESAPILTVMSNARDDFNSRYEILREVGKGGFSTVYQCRHRSTHMDYAVKVIDLRPLRLRERFNPARLKREVDIMRRLHHPSIIQFVEVYEDADHLMMVMEFCPGKELFDVILAQKFFREDDARPIFAQIAKALFYLHSLHIIHRDVKPENVLILNTPDPATGLPVAKLLDFGLSKNANGGSAAKTFVGTPCYLAPEVEYTSKGLGGTYGLPADCWSLGAVLYVMLVARFPEFEQDQHGKVVVKLPPALWNNVSTEAKELIRGLMNTNPAARLTMADVLKHPWMGVYRVRQEELTRWTVSTTDLSHHLQQEEERLAAQERAENSALPNGGNEMTPMGTVVQHHAMVLRQGEAVGPALPYGPEQLKVTPLLHLQRSIATCFEEAHAQYQLMPEVATQVRKGAVLCRQQMLESTKMLRKVEQTAAEVLDLFPDLELAIEEGEPKLAAEFFNLVKGWVAELRELVRNTQKINKASMTQIQKVVEQSTLGLQEHSERSKNSISLSKKMMDSIVNRLSDVGVVNAAMLHDVTQNLDAKGVTIDASQFVDLFMALFQSGQAQGAQGSGQAQGAGQAQGQGGGVGAGHGNGRRGHDTTSSPFHPARTPPQEIYSPPLQSPLQGLHDDTPMTPAVVSADDCGRFREMRTPPSPASSSALPPAPLPADMASVLQRPPVASPQYSADETMHSSSSHQSLIDSLAMTSLHHMDSDPPLGDVRVESLDGFDLPRELQVVTDEGGYSEMAVTGEAPSPRAATRLAEALQQLGQVDLILDQLGVFWANTEMVLDMLTMKGQHVEQFIGFASKPRLLARFKERIEEYKRFWEGVRLMCSKYTAYGNERNFYGFLEKEDKADSLESLTGLLSESGATSALHHHPHIMEVLPGSSSQRRSL